jgi:hypothetical protein
VFPVFDIDYKTHGIESQGPLRYQNLFAPLLLSTVIIFKQNAKLQTGCQKIQKNTLADPGLLN